MGKFYLTTAIDYANGEPHIGHAYEKIAADVIARYHRLKGDDVWLLVGMDEHGQKVAQAAADAGISPQQQVDAIAGQFQAMWRRLGVRYDQFIRTTSPAHVRGVQSLIERIFEHHPDDFYEKAYAGNYCVGCESFKQDAEIVDGKCALHPTRILEWVEEKNWFFRLSAYGDRVQRHIEAHPGFVQPESRRNEILSLLRGGLEDISASRARLAWGVPFPRPTSDGERQTTYVWFDALPNYLTATGFPADGFASRWPAQLHIIGKDITRFHCVIWPAMLIAADLPLPETVWAHGFVQLAGEKFSKSGGARLDLGLAIDKFGVDAFRYFLMREVPFDADGNFSWERFEERYNADLANALGNLASRTIAMVEKYREGVVPGNADGHTEPYEQMMDGLLLHAGLSSLIARAGAMNAYVDKQAPWKLAKDPAKRAELDETLSVLVYVIAKIARCLSPFMPEKAAELWSQLGAPGAVDEPGSLDAPIEPKGWRVRKGEPLFPKTEPAA